MPDHPDHPDHPGHPGQSTANSPDPMRHLSSLVEEVMLERTPSQAVLASAMALSSLLPQAPRWLDRAKATIATLLRDEREPAVVGVRNMAGGRHMAFAAGAVQVELEVDELDSKRCEIHGQVAGAGVVICGASVALVRPRSFVPTATGLLDERGYFRLIAEPGEYELAIGLPHSTVLLPSCHIP